MPGGWTRARPHAEGMDLPRDESEDFPQRPSYTQFMLSTRCQPRPPSSGEAERYSSQENKLRYVCATIAVSSSLLAMRLPKHTQPLCLDRTQEVPAFCFAGWARSCLLIWLGTPGCAEPCCLANVRTLLQLTTDAGGVTVEIEKPFVLTYRACCFQALSFNKI